MTSQLNLLKTHFFHFTQATSSALTKAIDSNIDRYGNRHTIASIFSPRVGCAEAAGIVGIVGMQLAEKMLKSANSTAHLMGSGSLFITEVATAIILIKAATNVFNTVKRQAKNHAKILTSTQIDKSLKIKASFDLLTGITATGLIAFLGLRSPALSGFSSTPLSIIGRANVVDKVEGGIIGTQVTMNLLTGLNDEPVLIQAPPASDHASRIKLAALKIFTLLATTQLIGALTSFNTHDSLTHQVILNSTIAGVVSLGFDKGLEIAQDYRIKNRVDEKLSLLWTRIRNSFQKVPPKKTHP